MHLCKFSQFIYIINRNEFYSSLRYILSLISYFIFKLFYFHNCKSFNCKDCPVSAFIGANKEFITFSKSLRLFLKFWYFLKPSSNRSYKHPNSSTKCSRWLFSFCCWERIFLTDWSVKWSFCFSECYNNKKKSYAHRRYIIVGEY